MLRVRLCVLALLSGLAVAGLFAGHADEATDKDKGAKKGEEKPKKPPLPLPRYFEQLGLRQDQERAIRKAQASYRAKIDELRKRIEKLRAEERQATEKVLTAEQLKRLRELRAGKKPND